MKYTSLYETTVSQQDATSKIRRVEPDSNREMGGLTESEMSIGAYSWNLPTYLSLVSTSICWGQGTMRSSPTLLSRGERSIAGVERMGGCVGLKDKSKVGLIKLRDGP